MLNFKSFGLWAFGIGKGLKKKYDDLDPETKEKINDAIKSAIEKILKKTPEE